MVALEDKGTAFEPAKTSYQPPAESPSGWIRFAVDPGRDEVYAEDGGGLFYRWDGKTGNGGLLKKDGKPFYATDLAVGYDGLLYFQTDKGFSGPLGRYTHDLQPAPYPSGTHVLTPYIYGRWGHGMNCEKGLGVSPHGEVYISFMYSWCKYLVGGFGPDGKPMNGLYLKGRFQAENYKQGQPKDLDSAVIGPIPAASGGVGVDLAGNIYAGICALPEGCVPPAGFEKDPAYAAVGSVLRFGPKGGAILGIEHAESKQPDAPRIALSRKMVAENATKVYEGIGPFSGNWASTSDCCVCRVPRFGLDRYGRLYLPNAIANSVRIVDNNNNLIVEFGKYGNLDSQYVNPNTEAGKAGKPTVAVPEIPLAWPTGAGASEEHVYVNDSYNNRAVRADFTWQADETCDVK
jgi:hypothetical protein